MGGSSRNPPCCPSVLKSSSQLVTVNVSIVAIKAISSIQMFFHLIVEVGWNMAETEIRCSMIACMCYWTFMCFHYDTLGLTRQWKKEQLEKILFDMCHLQVKLEIEHNCNTLGWTLVLPSTQDEMDMKRLNGNNCDGGQGRPVSIFIVNHSLCLTDLLKALCILELYTLL